MDRPEIIGDRNASKTKSEVVIRTVIDVLFNEKILRILVGLRLFLLTLKASI